MSFAIGSFGVARERHRTGASEAPEAEDHADVSITATLSPRGDRAVISITAPAEVQPGVAEVNALLVGASIPTLALIASAGRTRVTVPADAQAAAVALLSECAAGWEAQAALRRHGHFHWGRKSALLN